MQYTVCKNKCFLLKTKTFISQVFSCFNINKFYWFLISAQLWRLITFKIYCMSKLNSLSHSFQAWDIYFLFEITVWNNHFFLACFQYIWFLIHLIQHWNNNQRVLLCLHFKRSSRQTSAGCARENQFLQKLWQVNSIVPQMARGEDARRWNSDFSSSSRQYGKNLCSDHYCSLSFQQSPVLLLWVRQDIECQLAINYSLFEDLVVTWGTKQLLSLHHLHPSSFIHMHFSKLQPISNDVPPQRSSKVSMGRNGPKDLV